MYPKVSAKKYTILDDGSLSSRDSIALDQVEKQSLVGQMQAIGLKSRERTSTLLARLTVPWLVSAMLALANVLLVIAILNQQKPSAVGGHKIWMPPENTKTSIFELQSLYGMELNNESEAAWNAMMPVGRGFVIIKNDTAIPDQPGLDQSVPEQKAMVSVFHQLHCLYMTREGYYRALQGGEDQVSSNHLLHCFDYLRQAIMCFGDTTLEWLPAPPKDIGSTGWGFEHKCRDFEAISRWVEDNRLKTTHGIH